LIFPDSPPPLDSFDPVAVEDLSEAPLVDVDGEGAAVEPDELEPPAVWPSMNPAGP
jgi:hypothetical protein